MATLFDQLDAEWATLAHDRNAARDLRPICDLAGPVARLADLEHHVRHTDPAGADRVLLALVARVVHHDDQLAARVLLQLLLPGTRVLARRWATRTDRAEAAAAAVTAVYDRIRTYPLASRPGRIAANILLDAAKYGTAALSTSLPGRPLAGAGDLGDRATDPDHIHPADELGRLLLDAVHTGHLSAEDAHLIATARIAGTPLTAVAARRGAPVRELQRRRKRAEATLVQLQAAA